MNKLLKIIIFTYFFSFLPTLVAAQQQEKIFLNQEKTKVIEVLGEPLKISTDNGHEVLWYVSKAPSKSSFYYFESGKVVLISQNIQTSKRELQDYIEMYGSPDRSILKYSDFAMDSRKSILHIWPKKGLAVISYGNQRNSLVVREKEFHSMDIGEYLNKFGSQYQGNNEIKLDNFTNSEDALITSVSNIESQFWIGNLSSQKVNFVVFGLSISILLIVVGGIIHTYLWKKQRQRKNLIDESFEH